MRRPRRPVILTNREQVYCFALVVFGSVLTIVAVLRGDFIAAVLACLMVAIAFYLWNRTGANQPRDVADLESRWSRRKPPRDVVDRRP